MYFPLINLTGSICALATPFRGDAVDLDAFVRLIDFQLRNGTQGLMVAGSTGEAHALDDAEYDRLVVAAVERVAGRVPVLAGTGGANTQKTIETTRRARSLGVDAALVVTPYYVRPTAEGMLRHFSEVADHADVPIVLYNVPARTSSDLTLRTIDELSQHAQIIALKEARSEVERMSELVMLQNPQFSILSGDDATCSRAMLSGARGVISVAANVAPLGVRQLCDASLACHGASAAHLDASLQALFAALGVESNPIPLKWCLHRMGFGDAAPRLPLLPLSEAYRSQADAALATLGASVQPLHSHAA